MTTGSQSQRPGLNRRPRANENGPLELITGGNTVAADGDSVSSDPKAPPPASAAAPERQLRLVTQRLDLEDMAVCAPVWATRAEINMELRRRFPRAGWKLSTRKTLIGGTPLPHPCEDHGDDRQHWLASCPASFAAVIKAGPLFEAEVPHA